jgi:Zn-dependent peptidase ImmA (M78 family)/transcriptional regulator with XRE-family HTH domain
MDDFIGKRLTEVREARGHTLTSLVELLESRVTVAAISQYEKDQSSPRPEIAELIAAKLEIPFDFFFREPAEGDRAPIYWRSLTSATKTARTRARRRFEWLKEIVWYLRQFLEFPTIDLPTANELGISIDPLDLTKSDLERIASRCRQRWELGDGPIDDVVSLLEAKGIIVSRSSIYSDKLDAFSQYSSVNNTPIIFLAEDKKSAARSRLDATHELAHLILHRGLSEEQFQNREIHNKLERDALYFGAALLMPKAAFSHDFKYPTLNSFLYLKRKWNVSIAAMIVRAKELGLVEEIQAQRLWINYSRRGWKKQEPLDDVVKPEPPRLLRRGFEVIIREGIKTPGQIIRELALSSNDIEELAGLDRGFFQAELYRVDVKPRSIG